jgi:hypothetical protein
MISCQFRVTGEKKDIQSKKDINYVIVRILDYLSPSQPTPALVTTKQEYDVYKQSLNGVRYRNKEGGASSPRLPTEENAKLV